MNAATIGGLLGLAIGIALSLYVGTRDLRLREAGERQKMQFTVSLIAVPVILMFVGFGLGALLSALF